MIIRRKHTSNFTTIGNVLFDDERLAADEVGILAWLLRQHHDWEVRRPALMRRWRLGPVSTKRIINSWMKYGWCQAQKTRLSNGTFHIIYEIRDEPGREMTDEEIRGALSLVSSEAAEEDSEVETQAENSPDQPHPIEHPPPCERGVVDQGVVTEGVDSKKSLPSTDSTKTESTNPARAFDDVKAAWPSEHVVSLFACEKLHVDLAETMQEAAFNGIKPYLDDCRRHQRKICDLATFYKERRWERFAPKAAAQAVKSYAAKPGTPQWYRWRDYFKATDGPWRFMESQARGMNDYTVPGEWPPAVPHGNSAADEKSKSSTDPPKQQPSAA